LIVVHFHLRPGGIRRIIEQGTPYLVQESPHKISSVVLAAGEPADRRWRGNFARRLCGVCIEDFIVPSFGYFSEQRSAPAKLRAQIREALARLLHGANASNTLVWAHNLGIGRNALLSQELPAACARRGVTLVEHHHDWWFDNRWLRWPELNRSGVRNTAATARTVFPTHPTTRHLAINSSDAAILTRHFAKHAGWLPNLTERGTPRSKESVRETQRWLAGKVGRSDAPVWLVPCRLLRRKNIAEALLLTRWLRPGAWLVIAGNASSADEVSYMQKLRAAARRHSWPLRIGVLAGAERRNPSMPQLLAACEAVLLTSLQEGFGLPFLEAVAAGRPLIARALPNISHDLARFGFHFAQIYEALLVTPDLFDWESERRRQKRIFGRWLRQLPAGIGHMTGTPALLAAAAPALVPFSRLTLTAQLEVLAASPAVSWRKCLPLNPWLADWRERAAHGKLRATRWPASADQWLGGKAYGRRFWKLIAAETPKPVAISAASAAQEDFFRARLDAENLFPLLWSRDT
jgi:glycosyltransferase involved in cell wall biosynthesis